MAAQAVAFQDCRASGVNFKLNLIQTSLGRRKRGFYLLFCVLYVPCPQHWKNVCSFYCTRILLAHAPPEGEEVAEAAHAPPVAPLSLGYIG
jgi:hypothetical protein